MGKSNDEKIFTLNMSDTNHSIDAVDYITKWTETSYRGSLTADFLIFDLLEISKSTPTNLILKYKFGYNDEKFINLYEYRSRFIFQDGIYFLDIKDIEEFQIETTGKNLMHDFLKIELKFINSKTQSAEINIYGRIKNIQLR